MCKRLKRKCASGVFLDSFVYVTIFGSKYTSVLLNIQTANTTPDCGL